MKKLFLPLLVVLAVVSQPALAIVAVGTSMAVDVGVFVGQTAGAGLPAGLGGMALVTALSLIIGVQLVKRRRK